jgi:hypothetical protein
MRNDNETGVTDSDDTATPRAALNPNGNAHVNTLVSDCSTAVCFLIFHTTGGSSCWGSPTS